MKFKPEDFDSLLAGGWPAIADIRGIAAAISNSKLSEMLEACPDVYGFGLDDTHSTWVEENRKTDQYTHTARLVAIKKLKEE